MILPRTLHIIEISCGEQLRGPHRNKETTVRFRSTSGNAVHIAAAAVSHCRCLKVYAYFWLLVLGFTRDIYCQTSNGYMGHETNLHRQHRWRGYVACTRRRQLSPKLEGCDRSGGAIWLVSFGYPEVRKFRCACMSSSCAVAHA